MHLWDISLLICFVSAAIIGFAVGFFTAILDKKNPMERGIICSILMLATAPAIVLICAIIFPIKIIFAKHDLSQLIMQIKSE